MGLKKILSISLILAILVMMMPSYAFAEPSEIDVLLAQMRPQYGTSRQFLAPVEVYTLSGKAIRNRADLENILSDMDGDYYLTNDIDLAGIDWAPLGSSSLPFTGTIDGQGYEIKNLTIDLTVDLTVAPTANTKLETYAGLFARVEGAKFKNLGIDGNARINVAIDVTSSLDVTSSSTPSTNELYSTVYAGGLFAYVDEYVEVSNCYNMGKISVDSTLFSNFHVGTPGTAYHNDYYATTEARVYAGGIYGYSESSGTIDIINCYNLGAVETSFDLIANSYTSGTAANAYAVSNAYAYIGGILGYDKATASGSINIKNCYNIGDVATPNVSVNSSATSGSSSGTATTSRDIRTGGLIGFSEKVGIQTGKNTYININNCFNTGNIGSGYSKHSGGILGSADTYIDISNSYNTGTVTGDHAGGIYGCSEDSSITKTYGSTNIKSCSNSGTINGSESAGGIYGTCYSTLNSVVGSFNAGSISADRAGGICGDTSGAAAVNDCYNNGTITVTSYGVATPPYGGGIIGYNSGGDPFSIVSECYNAGQINGINTGAICGYNGATVSSDIKPSCYWLSGSASVGVASGTDSTTELTDSEMQQKSSFLGFNFFNVWTIEPGQNNGYPYLRPSTVNIGIDYTDYEDIVVPGWFDGIVQLGQPTAIINLEIEQLIMNVDFDIQSFSIDGGATWKKVRKQFDIKRFPKLLDKGMTLHLADEPIEKKTKKPSDDAKVIIFKRINARPLALKSHIRLTNDTIALSPDYEAGADPMGYTLGTWRLSGIRGTRNSPDYIPVANIKHIQIGVADMRNKTVDERGYGTFFIDNNGDHNGIPIEPYSGRVVKTSYYIRIAPTYSGGVYTPASKPKRIYARGAAKAPRYKIKKDATLRVKAGTYVQVDGNPPVLYNDAATINVDLTLPMELWMAATSKKAASEKQLIPPTIK